MSLNPDRTRMPSLEATIVSFQFDSFQFDSIRIGQQINGTADASLEITTKLRHFLPAKERDRSVRSWADISLCEDRDTTQNCVTFVGTDILGIRIAQHHLVDRYTTCSVMHFVFRNSARCWSLNRALFVVMICMAWHGMVSHSWLL